VLHGIDTAKQANAYLKTGLFTSDVIGALKPLLDAAPDVRIWALVLRRVQAPSVSSPALLSFNSAFGRPVRIAAPFIRGAILNINILFMTQDTRGHHHVSDHKRRQNS